jgi:hypothetical protein
MTSGKRLLLSDLKPGDFALTRLNLFASLVMTLFTLSALLLTSCGGNSPALPVQKSVEMRIDPSSTTLDQGATRSFTATVTGSTNTAVSWKVAENGGGTITQAGLYTAPLAAGTFHVIATSQDDSRVRALAAVTVSAISVAIAPAAITLPPGGIQTFGATVTGPFNKQVTWTVQEGMGGGLITTAGLYTAPPTTGLYHVVASSVVSTSASAIASVTVTTDSGSFSPTGGLQYARLLHSATLLPDGKVLVVGGAYHTNPLFFSGRQIAEVFDPRIGLFTLTSRTASARYSHTATLLPNGKVLVTGGLVSVASMAKWTRRHLRLSILHNSMTLQQALLSPLAT